MLFTIFTLMILVAWVFFIFSISIVDEILVFISGCILIITGIYLMVNGLDSFNTWVTQSLAVVQIGIGMVSLTAPFEMLGDGW